MNTQPAMVAAGRAPASMPAPIRLMKVLTGLYTGGTELQVLNLSRGLDRQRFDLRFACLEKEGDHLHAFEALQAPISEFRIRQLYHPRTFWRQKEFAAFLRSERIQVAHSYNFYSNVFSVPAARLAGVPVVLASVRDRGVYLNRAQNQLHRWVLSLADRILVNADSIRDWLAEQGLDEGRISVIKNGIDLSRYDAAPVASGVRETFGIPGEAPIVMLMARLDPSKGIDDFIKAAAIVAPKHPEARFVIVGATFESTDGVIAEATTYRRELERLTQSLGVASRVIFTGHRDDTPALLAEAVVSVLPSLSEGLSNTLLESMAAGVPTVATDVGGNPELVRDGVNGRLVPVRDPERLATAIDEMLANPGWRETLGRQARVLAREGHALPAVVSRTEQLYQSMLEQSKRSPT